MTSSTVGSGSSRGASSSGPWRDSIGVNGDAGDGCSGPPRRPTSLRTPGRREARSRRCRSPRPSAVPRGPRDSPPYRPRSSPPRGTDRGLIPRLKSVTLVAPERRLDEVAPEKTSAARIRTSIGASFLIADRGDRVLLNPAYDPVDDAVLLATSELVCSRGRCRALSSRSPGRYARRVWCSRAASGHDLPGVYLHVRSLPAQPLYGWLVYQDARVG